MTSGFVHRFDAALAIQDGKVLPSIRVAPGVSLTTNGDKTHHLPSHSAGIEALKLALMQQLSTHPNIAGLHIAAEQYAAAIGAIEDELLRAEAIVDFAVLWAIARDVNGKEGVGGRDCSVVLFGVLQGLIPEAVTQLLPFMVGIGSIRDLPLLISDASVSEASRAFVVKFFAQKILQGQERLDNGEPLDHEIHLLGKWMPKEGGSHSGKSPRPMCASASYKKKKKKKKNYHEPSRSLHADNRLKDINVPKLLAIELFGLGDTDQVTPDLWKKYREIKRRLSGSHTVHNLMCTNRFAQIDIAKLPSRASFKLNAALMGEGHNSKALERPDRQECRQNVLKFQQEHMKQMIDKVNKVQPYEIAAKVLRGKRDPSADVMWNAKVAETMANLTELANKMGGEQLLLPMIDVSASMQIATETGMSALDLAITLGLCLSLGNPNVELRGRFDLPTSLSILCVLSSVCRYLTFESTPALRRIDPSLSLAKMVASIRQDPWGGSTDLRAAFDVIAQLLAGYTGDVTLVVLTDQGFNRAIGTHAQYDPMHMCFGFQESESDALESTYEYGRDCLAGAGITGTVRIVFWNLTGRCVDQAPVVTETNSMLLNGFSPSLFASVMDPDILARLEEPLTMDDSVPTAKSKPNPVQLSPLNVMRARLQNPEYNEVRRILSASTDTLVAPYRFVAPDEWVTVNSTV